MTVPSNSDSHVNDTGNLAIYRSWSGYEHFQQTF
jgi:hypothetical protein